MSEEEWWSTYEPIIDESGNIADLGAPTPVEKDASGEWVERKYSDNDDWAKAMIAQHRAEQAGNPGNYFGGCLYLLIVVGVPAGLVTLFIWIANSIGFFDMIAAKWAMVP